MNGKIELTLIAFVLAALLSFGVMTGPAPDVDPIERDPFTANGMAWNN